MSNTQKMRIIINMYKFKDEIISAMNNNLNKHEVQMYKYIDTEMKNYKNLSLINKLLCGVGASSVLFLFHKIEYLDAKIDKKFEYLDAKIDKVNDKIDKVNDKIDKKFEYQDDKIDKIQTSIDELVKLQTKKWF